MNITDIKINIEDIKLLENKKQNAEKPKELESGDAKITTDANKNIVSNAPIILATGTVLAQNSLMIKDHVDTIKKMLDDFVLKWNAATDEIAEDARRAEAARQREAEAARERERQAEAARQRQREAEAARQAQIQRQKSQEFKNNSFMQQTYDYNCSTISKTTARDIYVNHTGTLSESTTIRVNPNFSAINKLNSYSNARSYFTGSIEIEVKFYCSSPIGDFAESNYAVIDGVEIPFIQQEMDDWGAYGTVHKKYISIDQAWSIMYELAKSPSISFKYNKSSTNSNLFKYIEIKMKAI